MTPESWIDIVGVTDGGARSLTAETAALVERADLLCGGERQLAFFPTHPARRLALRGDLAALAACLRDEAAAGRRVVVLASGDPLLYGIAGTLRRYLPAGRLRVHPNVSAVQLAWARVAEPWHDAGLVSVHGRPLDPVVAAARRHDKLAVLTDDVHTPAAVARALLAAGLPDRRAVVCERLGGPDERIVDTTLTALPDQAFDPLNVLLLLPPVARRTGPPWRGGWVPGLPDDTFARRMPRAGLITKREVRVLGLAALGLDGSVDVVWDVGAGSGSVAIEAALLLPAARVYAIERDPDSVPLIEENRTRFGAVNVTIVAGEAPGACAALPPPDAVFVGGSGGQLAAILALALARLRPGGRLVVNLATLEGLRVAQEALTTGGLRPEVTQVSVARGTAVGELTRLTALNPVFIVAGVKTMTETVA